MLIVEACEIAEGFVAVYAADGQGVGITEQWSRCPLEAASRALEAAAGIREGAGHEG